MGEVKLASRARVTSDLCDKHQTVCISTGASRAVRRMSEMNVVWAPRNARREWVGGSWVVFPIVAC